MCVSTVEQLQKVIGLEGENLKPIFGICMGNQLMGLAAGCTASKLPFGNRGQNQVKDDALDWSARRKPPLVKPCRATSFWGVRLRYSRM